jgi:hypothetical protein
MTAEIDATITNAKPPGGQSVLMARFDSFDLLAERVAISVLKLMSWIMTGCRRAVRPVAVVLGLAIRFDPFQHEILVRPVGHEPISPKLCAKGSQRWMQWFVNSSPHILDQEIGLGRLIGWASAALGSGRLRVSGRGAARSGTPLASRHQARRSRRTSVSGSRS